MLDKGKVAVCSDSRAEHIKAMWSAFRILGFENLWYVKLPIGFKRLSQGNTKRQEQDQEQDQDQDQNQDQEQKQ